MSAASIAYHRSVRREALWRINTTLRGRRFIQFGETNRLFVVAEVMVLKQAGVLVVHPNYPDLHTVDHDAREVWYASQMLANAEAV